MLTSSVPQSLSASWSSTAFALSRYAVSMVSLSLFSFSQVWLICSVCPLETVMVCSVSSSPQSMVKLISLLSGSVAVKLKVYSVPYFPCVGPVMVGVCGGWFCVPTVTVAVSVSVAPSSSVILSPMVWVPALDHEFVVVVPVASS